MDMLPDNVDQVADNADVEQLLAPVEPRVSPGKRGGHKRALPSEDGLLAALSLC